MAPEKGGKRRNQTEMVTSELIHCALVGDVGVGKSFLIRARACGTKYLLKEMFQLHISTVWTYDHYRTTQEVKQRSLCLIDGSNYTLKLLDTFGNKEIKRENVYSMADVVVICFSAGNVNSLNNVTKFWIDEVKAKCRSVPILLCACKIDLRYNVKNPEFLELQKKMFSHRVLEENIVYTETGKKVARQIGAYYYETSSLASYGIDDLFDNCIRAVQISRRRSQFLFPFQVHKKISPPHIQVPHAPPKPKPPNEVFEEKTQPNWLESGRLNWLYDGDFWDVRITVNAQTFEAHRVFLAAASPLFEKIFLEEEINSQKEAKISPCICEKDKTFSYSINVDDFPIKNNDKRNRNFGKNLGRFLVTRVTKNETDYASISNNPFSVVDEYPQCNSGVNSNFSISYCSTPNSDPIESSQNFDNNLCGTSIDSGGDFDLDSAASTKFDQSQKHLEKSDIITEAIETEAQLKKISSHHHINSKDYYSTVNEGSGIKALFKPKDSKLPNNLPPRRLSNFGLYRKLEHNSCNFCKKFKNSDSHSLNTLSSNSSLTLFPVLSINRIITGDSTADDYYIGTKTCNDIFEIELDEKIVEPSTFKVLLEILYSGKYDDIAYDYQKMLELAKRLKFVDVVANIVKRMDKVSSSLETVKISSDKEKIKDTQIDKIRQLFLKNDLLTDVCFGLDDGQIFAHRSLLSMHCEVFTAMFTSNFFERQNKCVDFRSASRAAFKTVQEYLYTGSCPIQSEDWLGALELANRLCLENLICSLQHAIINCLNVQMKNNEDIIPFVLKALKLSRLIETEPLAKWCLWYLSVEFENVTKNYKVQFDGILTDDKQYIERNRWPPNWYLQTMKVYNEEILELNKSKTEHPWTDHPDGCFAFNIGRKNKIY